MKILIALADDIILCALFIRTYIAQFGREKAHRVGTLERIVSIGIIRVQQVVKQADLT